MFIGYMRVSSADDRQSVDLRRDALVAAGVNDWMHCLLRSEVAQSTEELRERTVPFALRELPLKVLQH